MQGASTVAPQAALQTRNNAEIHASPNRILLLQSAGQDAQDGAGIFLFVYGGVNGARNLALREFCFNYVSAVTALVVHVDI